MLRCSKVLSVGSAFVPHPQERGLCWACDGARIRLLLPADVCSCHCSPRLALEQDGDDDKTSLAWSLWAVPHPLCCVWLCPTAHQQQGTLTPSLVEFPTSFWVLLVLQELFLNLACFDTLLVPCDGSVLGYLQNIFSEDEAYCCDQNWLLVSACSLVPVHLLFLFVKHLGPWAHILFWVPKVYHNELLLALWPVDTVELEIAMESELAFGYCMIAWALAWGHASNASARSN